MVFWRFCCGLKRNENQITFLEFFNLLLCQYNNIILLAFYCAHEAQSLIGSQHLITCTGGIGDISCYDRSSTYYDAASFAFVAVSAAEGLLEIRFCRHTFSKFLLHKLCDATTNYSQLRKVDLARYN